MVFYTMLRKTIMEKEAIFWHQIDIDRNSRYSTEELIELPDAMTSDNAVFADTRIGNPDGRWRTVDEVLLSSQYKLPIVEMMLV